LVRRANDTLLPTAMSAATVPGSKTISAIIIGQDFTHFELMLNLFLIEIALQSGQLFLYLTDFGGIGILFGHLFTQCIVFVADRIAQFLGTREKFISLGTQLIALFLGQIGVIHHAPAHTPTVHHALACSIAWAIAVIAGAPAAPPAALREGQGDAGYQ